MSRRVTVRDLVGIRDGNRVVDEVSFDVDGGEWVSIVGASGAGKSSLLRLLNRLDEPAGGTVRLDGTDYRDLDPTELRRRVGLVAQRPALRPGTVQENLTIGPRLREEPIPTERVEDVLSGLGLEALRDRDVDRLSGGEASRVMLGRTLVNDPEVLLLDEPTADLDSDTTATVESLLVRTLADGDYAVVLVTHDEAQAAGLGDRTLVLEDGRLVDERRTDGEAR